jgi:hypothetical protein
MMPYDEALAKLILSQHEKNNREAKKLQTEAKDIFARLGVSHDA